MNDQNSTKTGGKNSGRPWMRIAMAAIVVLLILVWQADLLLPKESPGEVKESHLNGKAFDLAEVKETLFPKKRRLTGSVLPRAQIESAPQISGIVKEVLVEAGDRVKAGDLLLRIDQSSPLALRDEAEAALRKAEAAQQGADRLLERMGQAVDVGALPETSGIEAEQAADTAARAVDQAKAALRVAEVRLAYTEIRSTDDAVIMETLLEPGDQAVRGRPAVISYNPRNLEFAAYVPVSLITHFPDGAEIACRIPALDLELKGRVRTRISRADPGSRTVEVKIQLDKTERLLPGMYGLIQIEGGSKRVLSIPKEAVTAVRQLDSVWVFGVDERLHRRFVRSGAQQNGQIEILAGLQAGERVLLSPEDLKSSVHDSDER